MRIMTFNLLFDSDKHESFPWADRRDSALRIIRRHKPHIIGTQEGMTHQLEFLQEKLAPDYAMVAEGRIWDDSSQYPTLFYRVDELDLLEAGESWLSKTPEVHLSKDWDSGFPRMMSHGVFRERLSGRDFIALATHLDHLSRTARLEQAKIIGGWLASHSLPRMLTGDFNDWPGSPVHRVFTESSVGMIDTWQALSREEDEESMTRHDRTGISKKYRMDWILHSRDFVVSEATILRDSPGGIYPSDHYPYMAELDWTDTVPV